MRDRLGALVERNFRPVFASLSNGRSAASSGSGHNSARALPVKFVPLERTDVSATLGKDSLKQAWLAAIGGLIAVAVFVLLLYRFLGLVAVIGFAIYVAIAQ